MGEHYSKNTQVSAQETTIKTFRLTYLRNCFCKNNPKQRVYLHTGLALYANMAAAQGSRPLPDERRGSSPHALLPALPTALGSRWLLQLRPKVASPGAESPNTWSHNPPWQEPPGTWSLELYHSICMCCWEDLNWFHSLQQLPWCLFFLDYPFCSCESLDHACSWG